MSECNIDDENRRLQIIRLYKEVRKRDEEIAALKEEKRVLVDIYEAGLLADKDRIAELEKVAEAAAAYRGYFCAIATHRQRERSLDKALREAGYLKEQG